MPQTLKRDLECQIEATRDKLLVQMDQMQENLGYMAGEIRKGKRPRDRGIFVDDVSEIDSLSGQLVALMNTLKLLEIKDRPSHHDAPEAGEEPTRAAVAG